MKRTSLEVYRTVVVSLVREISDRLHWINIVFGTVCSIAGFALKSYSIHWLTPALLVYFTINTLVQGTLALHVRIRTGKWPPPRLTLTLIYLSCMTITAGAAMVFGAAGNTTALIEAGPLFVAIFVAEYFSGYRRKRRAARQLARFTRKWRMSNQ